MVKIKFIKTLGRLRLSQPDAWRTKLEELLQEFSGAEAAYTYYYIDKRSTF